jgi:hypothetical protein
MTRQELLKIFEGSPDGPMRFLRRISREDRMFAGNHRCRKALMRAGFISVAERTGQWWRLCITDQGRIALAAETLICALQDVS